MKAASAASKKLHDRFYEHDEEDEDGLDGLILDEYME